MRIQEALDLPLTFEKPANELEKNVNTAYDAIPDKGSVKEVYVAEQAYEQAIALYLYRDIPPRDIDRDELLRIRDLKGKNQDTVAYDYKVKTTSPVKAARAFCVDCQGGHIQLITDCPSFNCPLWSFRMGVNALYGRVPDADAEIVDEPIFEEDDGSTEKS